MWRVAGAGTSRLLSEYSSATGLLVAADEAARLSSSDAEAQIARAAVLSGAGEFTEAVKAFERAVALRPEDYVLWMELGRARDQAGDVAGAETALREAVRLAPHYAQPRWQLGNVLLRAERYDEAFTELRRAATSDPALFPNTIDLAWGRYQGDARAVEQAIQPQTTSQRLALARFFAKHDRAEEAIGLFHTVDRISNTDRRLLLGELLAAKHFAASYEVWMRGREETESRRRGGVATLFDGGFEGEIVQDDIGFGWQVAPAAPTIRIVLDASQPHTGARSLRIEFNNASDPYTRILSQLALVEPNARYRLSFAARTEEVVTGGLPMVAVIDVGEGGGELAQSKPLSPGTSTWQDYSIDFTTAKTTEAVVIAFKRQNCSISPCAIFGRVWVDDFCLQRL